MLEVLDACCPEGLFASRLSWTEAERLADTLRVLADPARLRVLTLIAGQPSREACVCDVTDAVGLAQPTVSHHLKVLTEAGLLEREQRGRWAYYRLLPEPLARLRDALAA
jgi:ArsR family transcriptional regulator